MVDIEKGKKISNKEIDRRIAGADLIMNFQIRLKTEDQVKNYIEKLHLTGYKIQHVHWYRSNLIVFVKIENPSNPLIIKPLSKKEEWHFEGGK